MVIVAKTAGFCFGVSRAVELVYEQVKQNARVCTLGPIIHNRAITEDLEKKGVRVIESPEQAQKGELVVIRSHGVSQSVYDALERLHIPYKDATCPFVAKIHKIVKERSQMGDLVLIAGDEAHPEVQGIMGHCEGACKAFLTPQELEEWLDEHPDLLKKPVSLVAQTTFGLAQWQKCTDFVKKVYTNPAIFDTICCATDKRQREAQALAKQTDMMIVVGGYHSSNTVKLREVCEQFGPCVHIEEAHELLGMDFTGCHKIGVTAGASTPACIIKEVQTTMSEILNNLDDKDFCFEEALEQSLKSVYNGDKVTGVVTAIAPNEVQVEIGTKHAGYIPLAELTDDPAAKPEDIVKVGDQLDLVVVRVNDVEGTVMLSKKRFDAIGGFEKVMNAAETQEVLEGVVVDVIRGGILVVSNGVRVFVPASQTGVPKDQPLESLLKKTVQFKVLEANRQRRRAVGSIRVVQREQRKAAQEKFWEDVAIGKVYKGAVKSITSYGVFVDLGGVDGMVHISELSWKRIKHPSDVVKVGDVLEVYVKDLDTESKKISLGYKKTEDDPWVILKNTYKAGDVVKAKIVSVTTFGAFAQVIPGVDGLIHISQIANQRIDKVSDVLKVGQEVDVKITDIDFEKKRVSLSMRALLQEEEPAQEAPAQEQEAPAQETEE